MSPRRPPRPGPVYGLADVGRLGLDGLTPAVAAMAAAGLTWIQVRAKDIDDDALCAALDECFGALEGDEVQMWMNDRADLAVLFPFAGLHLGQRDLPPSAARRVVGEGVWIGLSTHDREQLAAAAEDADVDVVAIGPVFSTTGKDAPDPEVGLDGVRWARSQTDKPLVAIGGIDAGRVRPVLDAGADTAAVLGALCVDDVAGACGRLLAAAGGSR